MAATAMQGGHN